MLMPGRTFTASTASNYRYGFNGQEKADEIDGVGNHTTAEFWEYDPRIGRRWNLDPIYKNSPYEAFGGNPILYNDENGLDTIRITRTKLVEHLKGQNGDGHSDVLSIPAKILTRTYLDFDIKASAGKDVFIFQENIFSTDVNGDVTLTLGQPVTLDIDNLASTHPGIAQGQYPIMDGLFGLGTEDLDDRRAVARFMDIDGAFNSYMLGHNPEAQQMQNEDASLTVMNGLMPAAVKAGFGSYLGWRFSNPSIGLDYRTPEGNYPAWSTVTNRYWKIMNDGETPTGTALVRVTETGQVEQRVVSMELHHLEGRAIPNPHAYENLQAVWPWEHAAIDPARRTGYEFIKWIIEPTYKR
jgi:hypothetical protein